MITLSRSALVVAFLVLGGCGGQAEEDEELVIDDNESALSGVESTEATGDADADRADDGCRDGDHDGHKHHRRHWFKILDLLDGNKDKSISIAALPAGLPDRLLARLQRIDKDDDGVVTKKEAKRAWRHRHRHRDGERPGDERDDD